MNAWRTQALYTAVVLQLPDHVAAGHTTSQKLAEATGADEDGVHRLMRLLVGLGVFTLDATGGYQTTQVSTALCTDRPGSLRDMCLLYGEEFYTAWTQARHAVTTGTSGFERVYDRTLISYLGADPDAAARFQRAMRSGNLFFDEVATVLDLSGQPTIVDVGGGGQLLSSVLRAEPHARGVLVNLEHMVPIAREHLDGAVGPDRVDVLAQDIFESVPAGGDVYLLSRVLGDWDDDAGVRLLGNIRDAMSPSATLLVLERVVPDDGSAVLAALWDLHLLVMNGGRHRTLDDMRAALLDRADLRLERVADLPMETSALIVAHRT